MEAGIRRIDSIREQKSIMDSDIYTMSSEHITVPIGTRELGEVVIKDLYEIPHVLVCGISGSGKTSFVQTLLAVICKNAVPDNVKLIIFDINGVDYVPFSTTPHMHMPIISKPEKAKEVIRWMVHESKERFGRFATINCKDLAGYNKKMEVIEKEGMLPTLLLVIDDISMLNLNREEQDALQIVLKNGRIAGIHVIVISSLPSTRVLQKELIANIPCKISFRLPSKTESKAVLDSYGAEKLSIPGEMLYKFQGELLKCRSIHSEYANIMMSMSTVKKPAASISGLGDIAASIFEDTIVTNNVSEPNDEVYDELLYDAGMFLISVDKASIGSLQRKFKIGFNRAFHIMEQLSDAGLVSGEIKDSVPREVLMSANQWKEYCDSFGIIPSQIYSEETNTVGNKSIQNEKTADNMKNKQDSDLQLMQFKKSSNDKDTAGDVNEEQKKYLRDFPKFEVDGETISISDNEIKYSKRIMTLVGPGHMTPSFGGSNITKIIYKKPTFFSKGYFTFEFVPDVTILGPSPGVLKVDSSNISEVLKVQFGTTEDHTIQMFLRQISEDIGLPISKL